MQTPTRQWRMPSTLIVQILIFFTDALLPVTNHSQPTLPTCNESPQQVAAGGGLIQLVGQCSVALQLHLSFVKQLGRDDRGGIAPHPLGWRSIAAAGFKRVELCDIPFAIARRGGLTIIVTGLSGINAVGQERADRGRMPDVVKA
jgi:hypothetical protein